MGSFGQILNRKGEGGKKERKKDTNKQKTGKGHDHFCGLEDQYAPERMADDNRRETSEEASTIAHATGR